MIIGIYTGRVMLEALGIDNYGIQNVVGGIVAFSSLIVGSMSTASGRFFTFALGEGDLTKLKNVFVTSLHVHIILAVIVVLLLEICGVYFLNNIANIPVGRTHAANYVLQFSIFSTFISIACVPFTSAIIAHEEMGIYAYMSIFDAVAKLAICYLIMAFSGDRLILYSLMYMCVSIIYSMTYVIYCWRKFKEVCYRFQIDKNLVKEITKFSGWNLLHYLSWILSTQGVNFLINIYFGVAFNAARGIANTVGSCIKSFVYNFTTAFTPQITKSFANREFEYTYKLVNNGTKYSWFMMYLFIVPVCMEANTILKLWLVEVPPMAPLFLIFTMFESIALLSGDSLYKLILADGRVKTYSIAITIYQGIIFPLSWLVYKLGAPVWASYPIFIFVFLTINIIRLIILHRHLSYRWKSFVREVVWPCSQVSVISFLIPIALSVYLDAGLQRFFIMIPVSIVSVILSVYFFGLTSNERVVMRNKTVNFVRHKLNLKCI